MKKILLSLAISFFLSIPLSNAQHTEECASGKIHTRLMQNDPIYAQKIQSASSLIKQFSKSSSNNKSGSVLEIPVVVHIIHTGQAVGTGANISMTQINSAITRMNDRYRNTHGSSVDTEIQFTLAQRDPDGNATTGVNRINGSSVANYATEGITAGDGKGAVEDDVKALSRWSNTDYYNIWVVSEIEDNNGLFGIQGYAYFPGASSSIDGTVIMHTCFGTTGTVNSFNNEGRTLVHELGHGLNLFHTFEGDNDGANCPPGNGDEVADTDPHIRASSNCPTGINTCTGGSIDNVTSNFMNYSSQTCALEFTAGQSTRMRAAIMTSRPSLLSSLGGTAPGATVSTPACTTTTSQPTNGFGIGILGVELNDLNVVSGATAADGGSGYIDRSKLQQVNVDEGGSYTLTITTGNSNNEDVAVFIDYNNDGDFLDANETVFTNNNTSGSPVNSIHTGSIAIPSSGITTNTPIRMRVISDWYNNSITGSCYNPTFGQTEDYALLITASGPALSVSISTNNISCNGNSNGSATATAAGGTSPYTFAWTDGSTTATTTGLSAGIYTITVSDNAGSTVTSRATISEPSSISATLTASDESCSRNDGAISTIVSGGSSPYSYFWSNSSSTASLSNIASGTYSLTITDANGCSTVETASVSDACSGNSNIMLRSNFCGQSGYDQSNSILFFETRNDASNYRVRVNGSGVSNFVITTSINRFNLNEVSGMQYSQSYTVEIAAFVGGQWLPYGNSCTITTGSIAGLVNLMIKPEFCGASNIDPSNHLIYFFTRSDASNYRVRVNGPGVSNFVYTTAIDRFNLSDIPGMQYSQTYSVEIAGFVGGQFSNYGTACNITTGSIAGLVNLMIKPEFCGATGLDISNQLVYFRTRNDASAYRVRVNGPGVSNFILTTSIDRFNLGDIPGMQYSQTYSVEIAATISGQSSNFGTACNITTGSIAGLVNLMIKPQFCGATDLDPSNHLIYFFTRSDASAYRVRVNGPGVSNFIHTTSIDRFNLNDITGIQYGQTYSVEIAATISGQSSSFGTSCNISTGSIVSTVNLTFVPRYCGVTLNPTNNVVYFRPHPDATNYRIRVNGAGISNATHLTANKGFNLNVFAGWQAGQSYTLEVAAFINGQFSNYGTACSITTPPVLSPSARKASISSIDEKVTRLPELSIYPNPSPQERVYIKYNKSIAKNHERVILEVYGMNGQRVLKKILQFNNGQITTDINENQNLKAGIYLINIIDGEKIMTEKLVITD